MAEHDLIARYVEDLGRALRGSVRHAERACSEIDDHLRSMADDLRTAGLSMTEAERRSIECFGPVDELASSFLTLERDGAGARASRFTTRAGLVGAIGGLLIAISVAGAMVSDSRTDSADRGIAQTIGFGIVLLAFVMIAVGFVGIVARHRGTMRRTDRVALALLATGLLTMWLPFWGILAVAIPLMLVGTILFGFRVYRVHALPRPPLALILFAGAWLLALTYIRVDKSSLIFTTGWALVIAGWCWLQFTLWSERPEQRLNTT